MQESKEELLTSITLYDRTLSTRSTEHNAWYLKAAALVQLSDLTEKEEDSVAKTEYLNQALECYNKAIKFKPDSGLYLASRSKLHVKMHNPEAAAKDILEASKAPNEGVQQAAFVSYTAKELMKLKEVKGALDELKNDPNISKKLLSVIDQLTGVTENLVVTSGVHETRLDKHDEDINYLRELTSTLQTRMLTQEQAQQKTNEVLEKLNARVSTVEQAVQALETTCDVFKDNIDKVSTQNVEDKTKLEKMVESLQTKLSWQNDPELIQTMNAKLIELNGKVINSQGQIADIISDVSKMEVTVNQHSSEIKELEGKITKVQTTAVESLAKLPDLTLLPEILKDKAEEIKLKAEFDKLHADPFNAGVYDSIRSNLNAVWTASNAVKSGMVDHKMKGKLGIVATIMEFVVTKVPAASPLTFFSSIISKIDKKQQEGKIELFADLATNPNDMDLLADSLARKISSIKLNKDTLNTPSSVIDRLSQYLDKSLLKVIQQVESFILQEKTHEPFKGTSAQEEGKYYGDLVAELLISRLFQGDLLGKSKDEKIDILFKDIVKPYIAPTRGGESEVLFITDVVWDNPGVDLLFNGDWKKYGKSADELVNLGEQYIGKPDAFLDALSGADAPIVLNDII